MLCQVQQSSVGWVGKAVGIHSQELGWPQAATPCCAGAGSPLQHGATSGDQLFHEKSWLQPQFRFGTQLGLQG